MGKSIVAISTVLQCATHYFFLSGNEKKGASFDGPHGKIIVWDDGTVILPDPQSPWGDQELIPTGTDRFAIAGATTVALGWLRAAAH